MKSLIFYLIFPLVSAFAYSECPHIITKEKWMGLPPLRVKYFIRPLDLVIIENAESPTCVSDKRCEELVRSIQISDMNLKEYPDLAVSFLIGGNGNIYEGSGWLHVGHHTPGYDNKSIAISFMGNFDADEPTQESMRAAQALIQCGVDEGHLSQDYKLVGHKQLFASGGPGEKLYKEVRTWPHWTQDVSSDKTVSPLGNHTVKLGESWAQVKECGTLPPKGTSLILGDAYNNLLENNLPWYTITYKKNKKSYALWCGGSLVTDSVIISAAHCFWMKEKIPVTQFAVAVGKLYHEWDNPKDTRAQKSDIRDIKFEAQYQGHATNYHDDIALIFVKSPFQFSNNVRPVCLDFDYAFDNHQLKSGNFGKLSRWVYKDANRENSRTLEVFDMAYMDIDKCIAKSPRTFIALFTGDKFCASYMNDQSVLDTVANIGYGGAGLSFPENQQGVQRYYLRGVAFAAPVSTVPQERSIKLIFTQVFKHAHFIKENIE